MIGCLNKIMTENNKKNIFLITGPMFSGKTTYLIDKYEHCTSMGLSCIAFKPDIDTRYEDTLSGSGKEEKKSLHKSSFIISHEKQKIPCLLIGNVKDENYNLSVIYNDYDVVFFDEVQFIKNIDIISSEFSANKKLVFCSGLDLDYKQNIFEETQRLSKISTVIKKSSKCHVCDRPASYTSRRQTSCSSRILIGGSDLYFPICDFCLKNK